MTKQPWNTRANSRTAVSRSLGSEPVHWACHPSRQGDVSRPQRRLWIEEQVDIANNDARPLVFEPSRIEFGRPIGHPVPALRQFKPESLVHGLHCLCSLPATFLSLSTECDRVVHVNITPPRSCLFRFSRRPCFAAPGAGAGGSRLEKRVPGVSSPASATATSSPNGSTGSRLRSNRSVRDKPLRLAAVCVDYPAQDVLTFGSEQT